MYDMQYFRTIVVVFYFFRRTQISYASEGWVAVSEKGTHTNTLMLSLLFEQYCLKNLFVQQHQNIIASLLRLADSASLHLSIDFVLCFLHVCKKPLLAVNKMRHSSIAYRTFLCKRKQLPKYTVCIHTVFPRKRRKERMCVNQPFGWRL